ncbi:hypothetical protein ACP275_14G052900 [Erythranthe tilingii]
MLFSSFYPVLFIFLKPSSELAFFLIFLKPSWALCSRITTPRFVFYVSPSSSELELPTFVYFLDNSSESAVCFCLEELPTTFVGFLEYGKNPHHEYRVSQVECESSRCS